jgi:hypothetical protein
MADVFLSFKHTDRDRVTLIAEKLQGLGYSVWLRPAPGAEAPDSANAARELRAAKCILACWSQASSGCAELRAEAGEARARGVLAACRLDATTPPPPFDRVRCEDISDWLGESRHTGWLQLCATIGQRVRGEHTPPAAIPNEPVATVRAAPPRKALTPLAAAAAIALVGVVGAMLLRPGPEQTPSVAAAALTDATRLAKISNQLAAITARFTALQSELPKTDARRIRAELNAVIEIVALLNARVEVQSTVDAADWVTPENALAMLAEDIAGLEARLSRRASVAPTPAISAPRGKMVMPAAPVAATEPAVPAKVATAPTAAPSMLRDPSPTNPAPAAAVTATPPEQNPAAEAAPSTPDASLSAPLAGPEQRPAEPRPAEPSQPVNEPAP